MFFLPKLGAAFAAPFFMAQHIFAIGERLGFIMARQSILITGC